MGNAITTIFVCSPYRAMSKEPATAKSQLAANIERAKMACRMLAKLGYLPLAPHLYFTQFLEMAMHGNGRKEWCWGWSGWHRQTNCGLLGDEITDGMSQEISAAKEMNKPVRMMPEPSQLITDLLAAMKNDEPKEGE